MVPRLAFAQAESPPTAGWGLRQFSARLHYGLSLHRGQQMDPGPGINYSGLTPNDLSVWAVAYGARPEWLGAQLSLQREAFIFSREADRVTQGSLLRASLGLVARKQLGPVQGELSAGYGFAQLPVFSSSTNASPEFQGGARHAVLLGGRLRFPLFQRVQGEVRGEFPLALAAKEAGGSSASSSGFAAGASILIPVKQMGHWEGAVVADYQYVHDQLTGDSGLRSSQSLQRMGVALELTWLEARADTVLAQPTRPGSLSLRVVDAETKAPLAGAQVTLVLEGTAQPARTADAKGQVVEPELEPGEVVARVTAQDYEPSEGSVTVTAGERATLEISAHKRPPAVGGLMVVVVDKHNNQPVPNAQVVVGNKQLKTDAAGQVRVGELTPGPISVKVSAPEFQSVEDAAVVIAGKESEMSVPLAPAKRMGYSTIAGRVRSTLQGRPLVATLVIPSAKVKTRTDAQGAFSVKLKPGTYHIIISAKGHLTQTKSVTVKDGEQAIFNVDLFPRTR